VLLRSRGEHGNPGPLRAFTPAAHANRRDMREDANRPTAMFRFDKHPTRKGVSGTRI
jgi:hypothetical protein